MDVVDKLLLLRDYLSSERFSSKEVIKEELSKKLEICGALLESLDFCLDNPMPIPESELAFMNQTVSEIEIALTSNSSRILEDASKLGSVPKAMYLNSSLGCVSYEQVNKVPSFNVRGINYAKDGVKVKSSGALFYQRAIQVVCLPAPESHVAMQPWCAFPKVCIESEWLILNYIIPGASTVQVIACYAALPETAIAIKSFSSKDSTDRRPWVNCLRQFWKCDQKFCDERFKLIPSIIEGNWAVKMAVGQKPALTGKKLSQKYFRGNGYLEVDIDISTSSVAVGILSLVRGISKSMTVDIGITIQAEAENELPEVILCQTRFEHVDLDAAAHISS